MPKILINLDNIDKQVVDLIYDKQLEFRKTANKKVSLEKTINRLLREAYCNKTATTENES